MNADKPTDYYLAEDALDTIPANPSLKTVETFAHRCAWCKRWRVDTIWTPVAPVNTDRITDGICPTCAGEQLASIPRTRRISCADGFCGASDCKTCHPHLVDSDETIKFDNHD